jgi:hypothetical protein
MDLGLSGPKGKAKFSSKGDSPLKAKKVELRKMSKTELLAQLTELHLDVKGLKNVLLERLVEYWRVEYSKLETEESKRRAEQHEAAEDMCDDAPDPDDEKEPGPEQFRPASTTELLSGISAAAGAAAAAAAAGAAEPESAPIEDDPDADSNYVKYHAKFLKDLHVITKALSKQKFVKAAFTLLCQKWQSVIPKVIANMRSEYWGEPKGNWQRAICWLNNNNPLERFNRSMKDEWTFHKKMKWTVLFTSFMEYLDGVSRIDAAIPEPEFPYSMAPLDRQYARTRLISLWRKVSWEGKAIVARARKPYMPSLFPDGTMLLLNATYATMGLSEEQETALEALYCTTTPAPGEGFDVYVNRRTCFYVLTPDTESPLDTPCTCPYYLQRHTCKHGLSWGISEGAMFPDDCDYRPVTPHARKKGRPAEKQHCLNRDTGLKDRVPACPPDSDYKETRLDDEDDPHTLFDIPNTVDPAPEANPQPPNLGLRV